MHIEYRTIEGHHVTRILDMERGITIKDIDSLAMQYLEKTFREPEFVFMDVKHFWRLQQDLAKMTGYSMSNTNIGVTDIKFMLSVGALPIKVVYNAYTPLLVGTQAEYDDNDINKIFEDIVMRDFERV